MEIKPLVSVILPVYNDERYIFNSVESILNQTYDNFELIIINDGSNDGTYDILNGFDDARLKILNKKNEGLVKALNDGISLANGNYIARMDSDDIAYVQRLEKQVIFLEKNKDIDILCTDVDLIDENGIIIGCAIDRDFSMEAIYNFMRFKSTGKPIVHPSVMFRRGLIDEIGCYREFEACEDRDFWLRAIQNHKIARINERLIKYRLNVNGISQSKSKQQFISSHIVVINHELKLKYNIDFFECKKDIFDYVVNEVKNYANSDVYNSLRCSSQLINLIRRKKYYKAIVSLIEINWRLIYVFPFFRVYTSKRFIKLTMMKLARYFK